MNKTTQMSLVLAMTGMVMQGAQGQVFPEGPEVLAPQTVVTQTSRLNIAAAVVGGEGDSALHVSQTGDKNVGVIKQFMKGINQLVSQQHGGSNMLDVFQEGEQNLTIATQDDQGVGKSYGGTSYSRNRAPNGALEIRFRSGDIDFFGMPGGGAMSSFGRGH